MTRNPRTFRAGVECVDIRPTLVLFALLVSALCLVQWATVPDYAGHAWTCGGDAECEAEELATFGTLHGNNPERLGRFDPEDWQ